MHKISLRSIPAGLFIISLLLAVGSLVFSICVLAVLAGTDVPPEIRQFMYPVIICLLMVPEFIWLCLTIHRFFTVFTVTEASLTVSRPFRRVVIPADQVRIFGAVSFMPRGTQLFFCMKSKEQIEEYFHAHRADCEKLYRADIFSQNMQTEEGRQKLAMGAYIRKGRPGVYALDYGSPERLAKIVAIWQRPAAVTGAWLLLHEEDWKQFIDVQ